jgi:hypothetical protein
MTKVRLRTPTARAPRPRIGTRGETNAQRKEREIIRIYMGAKNSQGKGGAKLIEAHGALRITNNSTNYKTVPEDTVIIFLSKFGQCMSLTGQRTLANEYFTSDAGMKRFFRGEAGMAGVHHGEILSRTKFHGQKYPDVYLEFKDEKYAAFGWVWSLPTKYKRPENFSVNIPTANQVINKNIHGKNMRLSEVIARLGKGVYIVSSCLVAQNQVISNYSKIPYNLPPQYRARPAKRGTRNAAAFAESIFKKQPLRPGSFARRTAFAPMTGRVYKGPPKIRVAEVLAQLGRRPSRVNLKSKFPLMRANVNQNRLVRVQKILQDPTNFVSKLSPVNRNTWNKLGAVNKGAFVNRLMNRPTAMNTNNRVYYFRSTHPFTNQKTWFNGKGTRINQLTNVNESKLIPSNKWTNSIWKAFEGGAAYASPINMNGNSNSDPTWNAYVKNRN